MESLTVSRESAASEQPADDREIASAARLVRTLDRKIARLRAQLDETTLMRRRVVNTYGLTDQ